MVAVSEGYFFPGVAGFVCGEGHFERVASCLSGHGEFFFAFDDVQPVFDFDIPSSAGGIFVKEFPVYGAVFSCRCFSFAELKAFDVVADECAFCPVDFDA